jgi:hypothetical protein
LAAVTALPESQRDALLRTAVGGESVTEIARQSGTSAGAVRQLVYRARTSVRAAATAITPGPIIAWAAGSASGHNGAELSRIAEVAGGSAGVGSAGLALKGSSVLAIAVLGSSIAVSHHLASNTSPIRNTAAARAAVLGPALPPGAVGLQMASQAPGHAGASGPTAAARLRVNGNQPWAGPPTSGPLRRSNAAHGPAASAPPGPPGSRDGGGPAHRGGSGSEDGESNGSNSGHGETSGGGTDTQHDGASGSGAGSDGSSGVVTPSDSGHDISGRNADDGSGHGGRPDGGRNGDQPPATP